MFQVLNYRNETINATEEQMEIMANSVRRLDARRAELFVHFLSDRNQRKQPGEFLESFREKHAAVLPLGRFVSGNFSACPQI